MFGLATADPGWTRMVGLLAAILGWYYVPVARAELAQFIRWTIPA
ncbi:MAG: hypothetical protein WBV62_03535 [Roseobacter sp.]